tara:strand:+ start:606 stop:749 length:144 start_codon:yes stop_codon:yes gene_type:complete
MKGIWDSDFILHRVCNNFAPTIEKLRYLFPPVIDDPCFSEKADKIKI